MGISVNELFTLRELDAQAIFRGVKHPWEVLTKINTFILEYAKTLPNDFERIEEFVWVGKGTTIEKSVMIKGPAIIGYIAKSGIQLILEKMLSLEMTLLLETQLKLKIQFSSIKYRFTL